MGKIAKLCREFLAQNEHALEGLASLYFVALFPFWLYLAVTLTIPQTLNVATWVWNHPLHTIGICAAFVLVPTITAMVSVILWKKIVPFFIIASTGMGMPVTTILSLYGWLTVNWQQNPPKVNLPFAGNILGTAGFFFLISFLMGVPMLLIYMKLHIAETEQPT
ncbi:MAG: hypothetical protein QME59_05965, partial [Candidatus Hydrothermarchaeota archaeon]|nr:hypothetical protein [Candidatus Hydrothermarchaeota archaeon]